MRRFLFLLLRRAFAWPASPLRVPPRFVAPRDSASALAAVACRRAWGAIRALYPATNRRVPA